MDQLYAIVQSFPRRNDVFYLTEPIEEFEELYLAIREAEGRVYNDADLKILPNLPQESKHSQEWKKRIRPLQRITDYIAGLPGAEKLILDLGCGNGWFSNILASIKGVQVLGLDVNSGELEQAARVFPRNNLCFAYADIYGTELADQTFDIIILNSCVQYFKELNKLIDRLKMLLSTEGEIHILDSPFYRESELEEAQIRSKIYYSELGFPEMADKYFHQTWSKLNCESFQVLYNPKSIFSRMKKMTGITDSPFPWIRIRK